MRLFMVLVALELIAGPGFAVSNDFSRVKAEPRRPDPAVGEVTLINGDGVPGLLVVLVTPQGKRDTVVTNDNGSFAFPGITPEVAGTHGTSVEVYWGGKKMIYRGRVLPPSATKQLHIVLR